MKFCIVHYNTPELTTCLCSSINKFHNDAKIIILDNSDKRPFNTANIFNNVKVLDNTKEQLFKYDLLNKVSDKNSYNIVMKTNGCGSAKHSISIQYLIDNINENFILLDSDVLLKRSINDLIKEDFICSADIIKAAVPIRIAPFIIYFNIKKIKEKNICFFDKTRMNGLSKPINNVISSYDTGASFYEDILTSNEKIYKINYNDYLIHYGNGSWKSSRKSYSFNVEKSSFQEFLLKYKHLWFG